MESFEKGNMSVVQKKGENISKSAPNNWLTIRRFLVYLQEKIDFTPRYINCDSKEMTLSYVRGEAIHVELITITYENKVEMIKSAARLLREFHDSSQGFLVETEDSFFLQYEGSIEKEVMCHNDFAPYNVTFDGYRAVGLIDFDTICPAPREWDIAYGIYRFILNDATLEDSYETLMTLFLSYYGYEKTTDFYPIVIERLESLVNLFTAEIGKGNPVFIKMETEGHKDFYRHEIERIAKLR